MRTNLNIGELAQLMKISTHQIRYFEEKKVFFPSRIDENGYRQYDLDAIYRLSHILLLRKLDIPVGRIKSCIEEDEKENYIQLLEAKILETEKKIANLLDLKKNVQKMIEISKQMQAVKKELEIRFFKPRYLQKIYQMNQEDVFSVKDFYDGFHQDIQLYETDLFTLYDETYLYLCMVKENEDKYTDYILKEGDYLCRHVFVTAENLLEKEIETFFADAQKANILLDGWLIVEETSAFSLFDHQGLHYTIQQHINKRRFQ